MALRINKIHWPVTVLGYGRRIGIWTQGCSIQCKSCCSLDTWDPAAGAAMETDELLAICSRISGGETVDGITLSGGEPFDQAPALAELLRGRSPGHAVDLLCYSGYPYARLQSAHADVLALLDAVIAEPFLAARSPQGLRGSDNQRHIALTALGAQRKAQVDQQPAGKRLQYHVDGGRVWFVGIPDRGDLERLQADCAARGLRLDDVSWRS
jgi:anaerobic ribonucleoside-triphosphate reductase activating protein